MQQINENKQRPLVEKEAKILVQGLFEKKFNTVLFWFPIHAKAVVWILIFWSKYFNMGNNRVILHKSVYINRLNCGQECRTEYNSSAETEKQHKGNERETIPFHSYNINTQTHTNCAEGVRAVRSTFSTGSLNDEFRGIGAASRKLPGWIRWVTLPPPPRIPSCLTKHVRQRGGRLKKKLPACS